jgi:hypothetical protein
MNSNLMEFMGERVMATRQVHHMQYPSDSDIPEAAVVIDCPECSITCVVMPTFVPNALHLEIHTFIDGERVDVRVDYQTEEAGHIELMLSRPNSHATL